MQVVRHEMEDSHSRKKSDLQCKWDNQQGVYMLTGMFAKNRQATGRIHESADLSLYFLSLLCFQANLLPNTYAVRGKVMLAEVSVYKED